MNLTDHQTKSKYVEINIKIKNQLCQIILHPNQNISLKVDQFITQHQLPTSIKQILIQKIQQEILKQSNQHIRSQISNNSILTQFYKIRNQSEKNKKIQRNKQQNQTHQITKQHFKQIKLNALQHDKFVNDQRSTERISLQPTSPQTNRNKYKLKLQDEMIESIEDKQQNHKLLEKRYQEWTKLIRNRNDNLVQKKIKNIEKKCKKDDDYLYRKGQEFKTKKQKWIQNEIKKCQLQQKKLSSKSIHNKLHNEGIELNNKRQLLILRQRQQFPFTPRINKNQIFLKVSEQIDKRDLILQELRKQGKLKLQIDRSRKSVSPFKK